MKRKRWTTVLQILLGLISIMAIFFTGVLAVADGSLLDYLVYLPIIQKQDPPPPTATPTTTPTPTSTVTPTPTMTPSPTVTPTPTATTPYVCNPDPPGESDNFDDAIIVCSEQTVSGQVDPDYDRDDVYKIFGTENQLLTISMNGIGGDADLFLYPPGAEYWDEYVWFSTEISNDEEIQYILTESGFWFIDVYTEFGNETTYYNVTSVLSDP